MCEGERIGCRGKEMEGGKGHVGSVVFGEGVGEACSEVDLVIEKIAFC